jgi:hypothetical protein
MAPPHVTLFLEGMILLFFAGKDESAGKATSCQVGILRDAPGHIYEISITELGNPPTVKVYEEEDIRFNLTLEVQDTTEKGIKFDQWGQPFDRRTTPPTFNSRSFRWVLDLERDIYPAKSGGIGANRKQFRSVLRIDNGTFFTAFDPERGGAGISQNELLTCDEAGNPLKIIGKVATRVGVDIALEAPGSTVRFFNGQELLFEATPTKTYHVRINRTRPLDQLGALHHGAAAAHEDAAQAVSHHTRDANNFYNAVGHKLRPAEQVYFVSIPPDAAPNAASPPAGPEAACLIGQMGSSKIDLETP